MLIDLHKISIEEDEEHDEEIENVKISEQPAQLKSVSAETEISAELTEAPGEIKVETQP